MLLIATIFVVTDALSVAPDGITWCGVFRTVHWIWDDVHNFRPYAPTGRTISKHLGFDFTDRHHGRSGAPLKVVKAMTGVEGSLGTGWQLSAADLRGAQQGAGAADCR